MSRNKNIRTFIFDNYFMIYKHSVVINSSYTSNTKKKS